MSNRLKTHLPYILALIPAIVLRLHDTFAFRWGYDGGAHVAYFRTLAETGHLPTMAENYLAWHEPLYYAVAAAIYLPVSRIAADAVAVKAVAVMTSFIGLAFVAFVGLLAFRISKSIEAGWVAAIVVAYLPIAVFISQFPTNEIAVQAGMLGVIFYLTTKPLDRRRAAIAGLFIGSLTLIKLTAFVLLFAVIVWGAMSVASEFRRDRRAAVSFGLTSLLMTTIALAVAAPWQIHRATTLGGAFTINNFENGKTSEARALPPSFFTSFDKTILRDPFWSSGKNGFWSVLYADSWNDYANLFLEIDRADAMPLELKRLTDGGSWLPLKRDVAARTAILFSIPLSLLWLTGLALSSKKLFHRPLSTLFTTSLASDVASSPLSPIPLLWIFALGTFASLAYNVAKYPFLERGTLKMSFGLAGLAVTIALATAGLASLPTIKKRPGLLPLAVFPFFLVWLILAWPVLWV